MTKAMNSRIIHFDRNDKDTWAMARLHHSLLLEIQNSPCWEKEDIPDIPLTEEQMVSLVKGYNPDWDSRYAPYYLGGWFYITRSGSWVKKFKYQKEDDGYYHIIEHYTTDVEKGYNILKQVIIEGYFEPKIFDDRLHTLFLSSSFQIKMTSDTESVRTKGLEPLLCEDPRIIILGTLPGAESLIHKQYYYSNSNRIWKVLCLLTGESIPNDYAQKKGLLAKYHIVLWDYYESAIRHDSSDDKNIRDGKPNDIVSFLLRYPTIRTIAINGFGKYRKFGVRLEKKLAGIPNLTQVRILCLPETSGSNKNHGWGDLDRLSAEWKTIFE